MTATARDIRDLLGDIDPLVVERILELAATTDEIVEAIAMLADDKATIEHSCSPRVEEVRALLAELVLDEDLDGDYATA